MRKRWDQLSRHFYAARRTGFRRRTGHLIFISSIVASGACRIRRMRGDEIRAGRTRRVASRGWRIGHSRERGVPVSTDTEFIE
jgi:hypothetical protein